MSEVIWITGLSDAGKTTLANRIVGRMRKNRSNLVQLDGDQLRNVLLEKENNISHTREYRLKLALSYSKLCRIISDQNITVVISTISMFNEVYEWNRKYLKNYFEVYLKVPISELKRRDSKGIYKRFEKGEVSNVAGVDFNVDEPKYPDLLLNNDGNKSVEELMNNFFDSFNSR